MKEELVEWRPDWTPEERQEIDRRVELLRANNNLLRELRRAFGLTQADVARLLGATQSSVSKMEAQDDPRVSVLSQLVRQQGGKLRLVAEVKGKTLEVDL